MWFFAKCQQGVQLFKKRPLNVYFSHKKFFLFGAFNLLKDIIKSFEAFCIQMEWTNRIHQSDAFRLKKGVC